MITICFIYLVKQEIYLMNKRKAHSPIKYVLSIQKILIISLIVSVVSIGSVMILLDPGNSFLYIYAFIALLSISIFTSIMLFSFWWIFSIQKDFLDIRQTNRLLAQTSISTGIISTLIIMHQVEVLNLWTGFTTLLIYSLYQIWMNAKS